MSTIGGVDQLVAAIQAQLAARMRPSAQAANAHPGAVAPKAKQAPGQAGRGRYAPQNLAGLIELRINQIDRADPDRGRKAFRVFLEAVLLSHLGEKLVGDPKFFQLVDDVQNALEGDPGCAAMVDSAIKQLLAPHSD